MDASDLMHVWGVGRNLSALEKTLFLLTNAGWQDAESMTIGDKNRALLSLRENLFGRAMDSIVDCPQCGESLELAFTTSTLLQTAQADIEKTEKRQTEVLQNIDAQTMVIDGYQLLVRQPLLKDLLATSGEGRGLFRRCIESAYLDDKSIPVDQLPEELRPLVAETLVEQDPLLTIQLELSCPDCGESWHSPLDLLAYLWQEIDQWGERMLRTIHYLASAYGWSERDILQMSAWRRDRYMGLLNNG